MAVRAPWPEGKAWRNGEAVSVASLRGKVAILDFFTYGCINCINNVATMKALYAAYGDAVSVIGIHSPKFEREATAAGLREAIGRLGIRYAVIDDTDHVWMQQYAVKAWPTTVLVDRNGYIVKTWTGERSMKDFRETLEALGVKPAGDAASAPASEALLHFPQKLLCTDAFLAIANTGAGSVLLCGYDGSVQDVLDGFDTPMGMAWDDGYLYVADSGSGEVIRIALRSKERRSVLQGLRNPYDLALTGGVLLVAEAGAHRIAAYDRDGFCQTAVWGNRFEALRDGVFEEAQLAQPSGLSLLHDRLWFVDAESSSLRCIDGGRVVTAVGEGLHTFGDSDDGDLLLQHPQGVVAGQYGDGCGGGRIFIADTYNNKIKVYNPDDRTMMTLLNTLHEPCGIAKKGCTLYIADTNAHAIVAFDLSGMVQRLFL